MPFTRRQVYAGDGKYRRVRKGEALRAPLPSTNDDRERAVGQTFEDAVRAVLATPHLQHKHLVRLLEDPRFGPLEIIEKFPWDVFETKFRESERFLMEQLTDGAEQQVAALHGYFNGKDPHVLIWGARHAAEMVRHITEDQRRLLRNHVMNSHLSGIAPKQLAREIRNLIGLTPQWQNAVTKYHRGLLAKGVDEKFAAKQSAKYHDRLLKARAKTIARTEVMRAENEGKLLGWQQAMDFGFLSPGGKVRWKTAVTNVCPICLPMDGAEINFGEDFQVATPNGKSWRVRTPPSHPNCRCTILYIPPSVEELSGGLSVRELMEEITTGTYEPEPTPDLEEEDSRSGGIPDPPTFTRRREAQDWADTYLAPHGTETVHTLIPAKHEDLVKYRQWVRDYYADQPNYQVSDYDYDNPAMRRIFRERFPDLNAHPYWGEVTRPRTRKVDFEDLHIDAINPLIQQMVTLSREFPEVWDRVDALGTLQAIYRDKPGFPRRIPGGTYAQTTRDTTDNSTTIGLNKAWFSGKNTNRYREAFIADITSGWHPKTAYDEIETTVIHEIGHLIHYAIVENDENGWAGDLIDYLVKYTGQPPSFWNLSRKDCQEYVSSQLSRYAINNWFEFVAEAWVGYRTSPSPTPIMKAVGEWMVQRSKS